MTMQISGFPGNGHPKTFIALSQGLVRSHGQVRGLKRDPTGRMLEEYEKMCGYYPLPRNPKQQARPSTMTITTHLALWHFYKQPVGFWL